jgi:hypothetical protein
MAELERELFEVEERLVRSGRQSVSERGSTLHIFDVPPEFDPFFVAPSCRLGRRRSSPNQTAAARAAVAANAAAFPSSGGRHSLRFSQKRRKQPTIFGATTQKGAAAGGSGDDEDEDTLAMVDADMEFGMAEKRSAASGEIFYELEEHMEEDNRKD